MSIFKKISTNVNNSALIYPSITNTYTNVLLIDKNVKDAQIFADSVNTNTYPIMYSSSSTKNNLMDVLKNAFILKIDRIGIVFSSNPVTVPLFLDNQPFFTNITSGNEPDLVSYRNENVDFMLSVIKEFGVGHVDYLACNTLQYTNWTKYYEMLTQETGVVVGASNDKTGNIKYGGDWIMESTMQDIEGIYFTKSITYYRYLLDTPWATGFTQPAGIATQGQNMYVVNYGYHSISKITLTDSGDVNTIDYNWIDTASGQYCSTS
jgi:hypothetical protein